MKDFFTDSFIGVLFGALIAGTIIWQYFSSKLRTARSRSNHHIIQFLLYGDTNRYLNSLSSFLNNISFLRREYIANNKKDGDMFDEKARIFIGRFIDTQTEAKELFNNLQKGVSYVDPEVIQIVINAVKTRKEKIVALFEKYYTSLSLDDTSVTDFIRILQHPYFSKIELMNHFASRALSQTLKIQHA